MRKFKRILLIFTHLIAIVIGFAAGFYFLPILTAPPPVEQAMIEKVENAAMYDGKFKRDLAGSDSLHWGEGRVYVSPIEIAFEGKLAPGPDYKLYLSPVFVETKAAFLEQKDQMKRIADVKSFENFIVSIPDDVDPANFNTVVIWCEAFGQFITAATYQ